MQDKDKAAKEAILLAMCSRGFQKGKAIVFFRTKKQAHRAKMLFGLTEIGPTAELHGDMTQTARLESLDSLRKVQLEFHGLQNLLRPKLWETSSHQISRCPYLARILFCYTILLWKP